jgi:hypothetical protein
VIKLFGSGCYTCIAVMNRPAELGETTELTSSPARPARSKISWLDPKSAYSAGTAWAIGALVRRGRMDRSS